jgi:hypothetical protein
MAVALQAAFKVAWSVDIRTEKVSLPYCVLMHEPFQDRYYLLRRRGAELLGCDEQQSVVGRDEQILEIHCISTTVVCVNLHHAAGSLWLHLDCLAYIVGKDAYGEVFRTLGNRMMKFATTDP